MGRVYDYDIALSYAGENRAYVEQVAKLLEETGLRIFYDGFEAGRLLGKNLYDHFVDLYTNRAKCCVIFASEQYKAKRWTSLERQSAQARALEESGEYILLARFDDTKIPGVLDTTAYCDLRDTPLVEFVQLLLDKVKTPPEEIRRAALDWRANGYDVGWLLPEEEFPEDILARPTVLRDGLVASFLIVNLLYAGRTGSANSWVERNSNSETVARVLASFAVHEMRRVRHRAAGLLHNMDLREREIGVEELRARGAADAVVDGVLSGAYEAMLSADESLPPRMRSDLQKELRKLFE